MKVKWFVDNDLSIIIKLIDIQMSTSVLNINFNFFFLISRICIIFKIMRALDQREFNIKS